MERTICSDSSTSEALRCLLQDIISITWTFILCQVTFDTTKHLSDSSLKKRQQERLKLQELEKQREEQKRREKEEEERRKEEERYETYLRFI